MKDRLLFYSALGLAFLAGWICGGFSPRSRIVQPVIVYTEPCQRAVGCS